MPSIEEALAAYERQARANGRSPHSINQARRHVRALASWLAAEGRPLDVVRLVKARASWSTLSSGKLVH